MKPLLLILAPLLALAGCHPTCETPEPLDCNTMHEHCVTVDELAGLK